MQPVSSSLLSRHNPNLAGPSGQKQAVLISESRKISSSTTPDSIKGGSEPAPSNKPASVDQSKTYSLPRPSQPTIEMTFSDFNLHNDKFPWQGVMQRVCSDSFLCSVGILPTEHVWNVLKFLKELIPTGRETSSDCYKLMQNIIIYWHEKKIVAKQPFLKAEFNFTLTHTNNDEMVANFTLNEQPCRIVVKGKVRPPAIVLNQHKLLAYFYILSIANKHICSQDNASKNSAIQMVNWVCKNFFPIFDQLQQDNDKNSYDSTIMTQSVSVLSRLANPVLMLKIADKYQHYFAKNLFMVSDISERLIAIDQRVPAKALLSKALKGLFTTTGVSTDEGNNPALPVPESGDHNQMTLSSESLDQALRLYQQRQNLSTHLVLRPETITALGYCLYNMGVVLSWQGQWTAACAFYQHAFQRLPNDYDALSAVLESTAESGNSELISTIINQLSNQSFKKVLTLSSQDQLTDDALKEINKYSTRDPSPQCHMLWRVLQFRHDYQRKSVIDSVQFAARIKLLKKDGCNWVLLFDLCTRFKQEQAAANLIKTVDPRLLHNLPTLQLLKVTHVSSQGEDLLAEIAGYTVEHPRNRAALYYAAALSRSDRNNPAINLGLAVEYMDRAIALDPENQRYDHTRLLIQATLTNDNYQILIKQFGEKKSVKALLERYLPASTVERKEELLPEHFEVAVRSDLQTRRNAAAIPKLSLVRSSVQLQQWRIKDQCLSSTSDQIVPLDPYEGNQCYGCIGLKVQGKLRDEITFRQFTAALKNATIHRATGIAGVKLLKSNHALVGMEIKIIKDKRLYTTTFYQNESGALLLIFSKIGGHSDIAGLNNKMLYLDA